MARRVPRQRTSVRSSKASYLEIVCPNHEPLWHWSPPHGVWASPPSRVSYAAPNASPCAIPTPSNVCSFLWVRRAPHASGPESVPTAKLGAKPTVWPTSTTQHASQRQAAAEACDKVRQAFEILGDDIPDNLKSAGQLRLDHADASLEQLGRLADPPITKDAIAGRIRRLLQLAEKTEKARRQSA